MLNLVDFNQIIYSCDDLKGSRLIIQKIKELANESNIEITKIEWDGGTLTDL